LGPKKRNQKHFRPPKNSCNRVSPSVRGFSDRGNFRGPPPTPPAPGPWAGGEQKNTPLFGRGRSIGGIGGGRPPGFWGTKWAGGGPRGKGGRVGTGGGGGGAGRKRGNVRKKETWARAKGVEAVSRGLVGRVLGHFHAGETKPPGAGGRPPGKTTWPSRETLETGERGPGAPSPPRAPGWVSFCCSGLLLKNTGGGRVGFPQGGPQGPGGPSCFPQQKPAKVGPGGGGGGGEQKTGGGNGAE